MIPVKQLWGKIVAEIVAGTSYRTPWLGSIGLPRVLNVTIERTLLSKNLFLLMLTHQTAVE